MTISGVIFIIIFVLAAWATYSTLRLRRWKDEAKWYKELDKEWAQTGQTLLVEYYNGWPNWNWPEWKE